MAENGRGGADGGGGVRPRDPDVDLRVPRQRREFAGHELGVLGAIIVGGVAGAEARYGLGVLIPHAGTAWPASTVLTNVTGCFLIGVLMVTITELVEAHRLTRPLLGVGVLGGYTTFSTYTTDAVQLLTANRYGTALLYLIATPVLALIAVWLGAALTRLAGRGRTTARRGRVAAPPVPDPEIGPAR